MIKRTITYSDLDGNPVTEDFYFHFTKAELIEMEIEGDLSGRFQKIIDGKAEAAEALPLIKDFIVKSIGERDGAIFEKNDKVRKRFLQTEAYSDMLMELLAHPAEAANFINSLMPKGMEETVAKLSIEQTKNAPPKKAEDKPWITENREPTREELTKMSQADLAEAMKRRIERKDAS